MSSLSQITSPNRAGDDWIDLRTASQIIGRDEGRLRWRCREWAGTGHARQFAPPLGGKPVWHISREQLRRLQAEPSQEFDPRQLTDQQRLELGRRQRIVADWERALADAARDDRSAVDATAAYLATLSAREPNAPTQGTLYRWRAGFRANGAKGLLDGRWLSGGGGVKSADDYTGFYDELKRLYLDQRRRDKQLCYDRAKELAEENGWAHPSYRTACRYLDAIPRKTVDLMRNGVRDYSATSAQHVERDYTRIVIDGVERDMRSNDVWCADHHQLDVWVKLPGQERTVRPWLCGWQDVRSRKIVGWKIVPCAPDSGTIIAALRDALAACGKPLIAYTDNGKDFDSFALQGVTKRQRRTGATPTGGVFGMIGVEVRHARAYNAKAKPIERLFGTLCRRFSTGWPTYCGNSPAQRPDDLDRTKAPTWDQFVGAFADWLEADYHQRPHAGHGMEGKAPAAVYREQLAESRPDRRAVARFADDAPLADAERGSQRRHVEHAHVRSLRAGQPHRAVRTACDRR
jgi:hypothetical protein